MSQSSEGSQRRRFRCISCGRDVSGTNAAQFDCPECGYEIYRDARCRKQSNRYECPNCGFMGP